MGSDYGTDGGEWTALEAGLVAMGATSVVAGFLVPILGMSLAMLSGNLLKSRSNRTGIATAILVVGVVWALVVLLGSGGELMD